jgi:predicted transcriptional regulator
MTIEQELKALIVKRYGSAKNFALEINMPNSTLDNIFRRGVLNSSVTNIIKICNALEISADELADGKIVSRSASAVWASSLTPGETDAIKKYRALDERGKMAVDSTLAREYEISSRNAAVVSDMASTISAADVALTGAAVKK